MATLDTSIPLRALQGMYNPADTVQQAASLKDLVQQQQLRGLQIQDAMDARQRRKELRDLYAGAVNPQTGEIDYRKVRTGYAQMGDIEGLAQVEDVIGKMDDRQRAQAKARADTLAAAAQTLRGLPYEQRRAALMQMAPTLEPLGLTAEQLQAFDPTDTNIGGVVAQALGVKGLLETEHQDRTYNLDVQRFDETKRHNQRTEGIQQGQLAVAQGNLAVRRSEAQQRIGAASQGHVMDTPDGPMLVDRRTGDARPVTVNGQPLSGQAAQKRAQGASRVLDLLDQAEALLPNATSSYLGTGLDHAARFIGRSTGGSRAIAQLRALEGALLAEMPRMEGPQSDRDVQMYRQAAGYLGDPTIPEADKRAAIQTIREIQQRYAGGGASASNAARRVDLGDGWSAEVE